MPLALTLLGFAPAVGHSLLVITMDFQQPVTGIAMRQSFGGDRWRRRGVSFLAENVDFNSVKKIYSSFFAGRLNVSTRTISAIPLISSKPSWMIRPRQSSQRRS